MLHIHSFSFIWTTKRAQFKMNNKKCLFLNEYKTRLKNKQQKMFISKIYVCKTFCEHSTFHETWQWFMWLFINELEVSSMWAKKIHIIVKIMTFMKWTHNFIKIRILTNDCWMYDCSNIKQSSIIWAHFDVIRKFIFDSIFFLSKSHAMIDTKSIKNF